MPRHTGFGTTQSKYDDAAFLYCSLLANVVADGRQEVTRGAIFEIQADFTAGSEESQLANILRPSSVRLVAESTGKVIGCLGAWAGADVLAHAPIVAMVAIKAIRVSILGSPGQT